MTSDQTGEQKNTGINYVKGKLKKVKELVKSAHRTVADVKTIVAMSDTHSFHKAISPPKGDIFIHCGDHSEFHGTEGETRRFLEWVGALPHKHKIIIPGNHDLWCPSVNMAEVAADYGVICLVDESVTVEGLHFYGSPWVPQYGNWAYMYPHTEPHYKNLPENIDVLMTHGPPYGHNDYVPHKKVHVGGIDLLNEVVRVQPRFHVFGHIHEGRAQGRTKSSATPTVFIPAACWNHRDKTLTGAVTFHA